MNFTNALLILTIVNFRSQISSEAPEQQNYFERIFKNHSFFKKHTIVQKKHILLHCSMCSNTVICKTGKISQPIYRHQTINTVVIFCISLSFYCLI